MRHTNTRGEGGEGTDLNQSHSVYPRDYAPPTWISNNLSLKGKDDMKSPKCNRKAGTDGEAIEL